MGLLEHVLWIAVHLILIAVDLMVFFMLVRALCCRWRTSWLMAFDSTGQPIVDLFTGCVQAGIRHISHRNCSKNTTFLVGMLVLMFLRISLAALLGK